MLKSIHSRLFKFNPIRFRLFSVNYFSSKSNERTWKILRLNHVAIATPSVGKASFLYKEILGANVSEKTSLPSHGVNTVFIDVNNTKLELLDPIDTSSPIQSYLNKSKDGGIHHICLEVDDVKAAMADLKAKGVRILSDEPKIGAHGKPVIFLHPKDCNGVLIELEQV